ncbi:plexin domain-containing protein 1-like [Mytilus galloprovincialis]|uniref:plexin domain-containing protein 1-like n=1 Tax=Mytilus galloprovincialis TaxID=29158 RepID=UPI003F7C7968
MKTIKLNISAAYQVLFILFTVVACCNSVRHEKEKYITHVKYREHKLVKRAVSGPNSTDSTDISNTTQSTDSSNTTHSVVGNTSTESDVATSTNSYKTTNNNEITYSNETTKSFETTKSHVTTKSYVITNSDSANLTATSTVTPETTTQNSPIGQTEVPSNTTTTTDHHTYYKSRMFSDPNGAFWNELHGHTRHSLSNDKHLVYSFVTISFEFPFYGHMIQKFAITPLGFLYMSPFTHRQLDYSYTHYIAPLMANFDTIGNHSEILYKDNGNSFVIEWRDIELNDQTEKGNYTFQVTLFQNGTIMFVYKSIPDTNISAENWPVKIGLSDAFYYDVNSFFGFIRYIVKYHTVEFNLTSLEDNKVVILDPVPTCNLATTCEECTTLKIDFECSWCPSVSRCSDSLDRHRQEWLNNNCDSIAITDNSSCYAATGSPPSGSGSGDDSPGFVFTSDDKDSIKSSKSGERDGAKKTALIVVPMVAAVVLIVVFIIGWVFYARANPTTKSGQFLIKNRPSQLKEKFHNVSFFSSETGQKVRIHDDMPDIEHPESDT